MTFTVFQAVEDDLGKEVVSIEDLKITLSYIASVRAMSLDVEITILELQEIYQTLINYKILVSLII